MNAWTTELRRGTVELCVLSVLKEQEGYGYEIIERLRTQADLEVTESTIYPILARLAKDGLLDVRQTPSPHGPPRRYFRLNADGKRRLSQMIEHWKSLEQCVHKLLGTNQS
jgi:PadR family transcriptional regulator PadR